MEITIKTTDEAFEQLVELIKHLVDDLGEKEITSIKFYK
jgi:hypothetical protein